MKKLKLENLELKKKLPSIGSTTKLIMEGNNQKVLELRVDDNTAELIKRGANCTITLDFKNPSDECLQAFLDIDKANSINAV